MPRRDKGMRGLLWSHLLASVCGGLALAGVLLGFGVIGRQRTVTQPIDYSAAPPTAPGGSAQTSDTEQIYNRDNPGVVSVRAVVRQRTVSPFVTGTEAPGSISTGSGFLISEDHGRGYILTSFHLIEGASYTRGITVAFAGGPSLRASVIQFDQGDDIALLGIDTARVPATVRPLPVGDSQSVGVGDSTLAIANPYGLERTLSTSIVSSLQRQLTSASGTAVDDVIQTDAAPSPGASGSPLLSVGGQVIGINDAFEVIDGGASYRVGFAIPINTVRDEIIPKGVL